MMIRTVTMRRWLCWGALLALLVQLLVSAADVDATEVDVVQDQESIGLKVTVLRSHSHNQQAQQSCVPTIAQIELHNQVCYVAM
jgi:hypothetical protein